MKAPLGALRRRRLGRWAELPPPAPAPADLSGAAEILGLCLGTTADGAPVPVHGLDRRSAANLLRLPAGVVVEPASGRPYLIPDPEIRADGDLLVLRWRLGGRPVETRFQPDAWAEAVAWAA